jgi:NADPH:quinone reductase-like Zn-dependent oxidoreductase
MDVAGEIAAVGAEVDGFKTGDRVVIDPSMANVAANSIFHGQDDLYGELGVIGGNRDGGYAELCAAPASHVHRIPDGISFAHAACFPTVFMTAWHALADVGQLAAGETVMIHAAASGVSTAAIQIARRAGAIVLATAGSEGKLELARRLGADYVFNNRSGDVAAWAREITGGRGVDMVLDHVGPALWNASLFSLRPRGRLVFCGETSGKEASFNLEYAYHFGIRMLGSDPYRYEEFGPFLNRFWSDGYEVVIDAELPLTEVAEAHRRMERGAVSGKLVIKP